MFTTLAILVAIGAYLVFIYNGLVKAGRWPRKPGRASMCS